MAPPTVTLVETLCGVVEALGVLVVLDFLTGGKGGLGEKVSCAVAGEQGQILGVPDFPAQTVAFAQAALKLSGA